MPLAGEFAGASESTEIGILAGSLTSVLSLGISGMRDLPLSPFSPTPLG